MTSKNTGYSLYLMRHGIAVDRGSPDYPDDGTRPLTPKGRKRVQEIAKGLLAIGFDVDWVVTSPLVRARETAQLVASALPSKVPLDLCEGLTPGGSFGDVKAFLLARNEHNRVLLTGHEPDLSRLASQLIGLGKNSGLAFKKGGCCLIEWEEAPFESNGSLIWWLTPRLLRDLSD